MATVRASCNNCGDVEFVSDSVQIRICDNDGSGTWSYCCPGCQAIRQTSAPASTLDVLLRAGGLRMPGELPAELEKRDHDAPLFTHDDLLDFHRRLHERDDWMDLLVED